MLHLVHRYDVRVEIGSRPLRIARRLNRCPDQWHCRGACHRNSLPELLGSQSGLSKAVSAFQRAAHDNTLGKAGRRWRARIESPV